MQLVTTAVDDCSLVRHGVGTLRQGAPDHGRQPACLAGAVFRRRTDPDPLAHVDPAVVEARWRGPVEAALGHRRQFAELRTLLGDGPLRARLDELAGHVDAGVEAVWDVVQRGTVARRTLETMDPEAATAELKQARRSLAAAETSGAAGSGLDVAALRARVDALAARHASVQRLWNTVDDVDDRLLLLGARLGAVVAQVAELAAGATFPDSLDEATRSLDEVVESLAATREALDELDRL